MYARLGLFKIMRGFTTLEKNVITTQVWETPIYVPYLIRSFQKASRNN